MLPTYLVLYFKPEGESAIAPISSWIEAVKLSWAFLKESEPEWCDNLACICLLSLLHASNSASQILLQGTVQISETLIADEKRLCKADELFDYVVANIISFSQEIGRLVYLSNPMPSALFLFQVKVKESESLGVGWKMVFTHGYFKMISWQCDEAVHFGEDWQGWFSLRPQSLWHIVLIVLQLQQQCITSWMSARKHLSKGRDVCYRIRYCPSANEKGMTSQLI